MKQKITFTNWVTVEGKPVRVCDLPGKVQRALGNRVLKEPLRALGFVLEPIKEEPHAKVL
ncbi:hypothetical protein [Lacrimispora sp.]|uniref:hypothetical protein n=1 Tax=Lacrimispora sp. TaxID=2719234 RepID=UPI0028980F6E|nr:hypothetical protein [Lacrimispora sp.]